MEQNKKPGKPIYQAFRAINETDNEYTEEDRADEEDIVDVDAEI